MECRKYFSTYSISSLKELQAFVLEKWCMITLGLKTKSGLHKVLETSTSPGTCEHEINPTN